MSDTAPMSDPRLAKRSQRLSLLLAVAMFVRVVDTSVMNVSISAVVEDLDTTVSGVWSAIALEALVSAASSRGSGRSARRGPKEIIRINTALRPISLQIAILIPILAGLGGLLNSLRMRQRIHPGRLRPRQCSDRQRRNQLWVFEIEFAEMRRTFTGIRCVSSC
ncbi:MAG TPA: hypothetical protein VNT27_03610 [Propionibacteriaceae bacterium]|nr:hypothetical protein [Propionibacteriaceae bacterium]